MTLKTLKIVGQPRKEGMHGYFCTCSHFIFPKTAVMLAKALLSHPARTQGPSLTLQHQPPRNLLLQPSIELFSINALARALMKQCT